MAKAQKTKKQRSVSEHSRAARRAVSPSIDLDKSLKTTTLTTAEGLPKPIKTAKPHVLASQSPGIRKSKGGKPMKRAQRERAVKALERADQNLDKLEVKVQKSVGRAKKVEARKKTWDDLDASKKKKGKNAFAELEDEDDEEVATREREWVSDEEMPEVGGAETSGGEAKQPASIPQPQAMPAVEEDEML